VVVKYGGWTYQVGALWKGIRLKYTIFLWVFVSNHTILVWR